MEPTRSEREIELDNVLAGQLGELALAGYPAPVEPDSAESLGAFEDDALEAEAAIESRFDNETQTRGGGDE